MLDIFQGVRAPAEEAAIVARTLLEASLAGYDSHGVMRIPTYVDAIRRGTLIPGAEMVVLRESPACIHLDAGRALGPVAATRAVQLASDKASSLGIGCASVANSTDLARLGGYLEEPARRGMLGLMMVNDAGGAPAVAPWGGVEAFLSTNPLAAGIPRGQKPPIIIDMSTSVVALGKLRMSDNLGRQVPQGWLIDGENRPVSDPATFFTDPRQSVLLPLGGMLAGYKGFGLGLLVDVLAGGLGGAGCSTGGEEGNDANGIFVLVINSAWFGSPEDFTARVEALVDGLKGVKRAPGVDEILIPGERAEREKQARLQNGIPIDPPTRKRIRQILRELGLEQDYGLW